MKHKTIDYIILGGGCSALSLAVEIIKTNIQNLSFLIIESRSKYKDDRSWCFWEKKNKNKISFINRSWNNFSFSMRDSKVVHSSIEYQYCYVRSIDFYKNALKKIKASQNIDLHLNEKVRKIIKLNKKYMVQSSKEIYYAKNILDTRPKKNIYLKNPFLFQCFLGYEILLKGKKLNINEAGIMENMRSEKNIFFFEYILPIKRNTYLIEITCFSESKITLNMLKQKLEKVLIHNNITSYKIKRTEYGVIPMGFIKKSAYVKDCNYFYAGSLGGAIRPSSGYAFLRIQDWAKKAALSLKEKGKLISHPKENKIIFLLDKIFLKVLQKNIKVAPNIFFNFLEKINTASFIRFMSGNARPLDYIKIILAMPKKYFFRYKMQRDHEK